MKVRRLKLLQMESGRPHGGFKGGGCLRCPVLSC